MKQLFKYMTLAALLAMAGTLAARAADDLGTEAARTIAKFQQVDPGSKALFQSSAGYVVFPGVGKGGLIIGGEHGRGLVYQHGQPIGEATLTAASIGAQAGGESFDEVIFFQTPAALEQFKSGPLSFNSQISAVVAAPGAENQASYQQGLAVLVLPRAGLMGQATVGGQKLKFKPFAEQP